MNGGLSVKNDNKSDFVGPWLFALGLLVGIVAVSGESYWIDEASTVDKAIQPTVSAWWERLRSEGSSNLQLPLYLLYAWGWEKLFGSGEWAMRAANIPWFILGLMATGWAFVGRVRAPLLASLALATSAFVWFYVDEARPYAMQLGIACVVFASLARLLSGGTVPPASERRWAWYLAIGAVVLSASGMLAMIWLAGGGAGALLASSWPRVKQLLTGHWRTWAITGAALLAVGVYYLWTLTLGARATTIATTNIKSLAFTGYEMFGMMGLGPSRLILRSGDLAAFKPFVLVLLVYGLLVIMLWGIGWRRLAAMCSPRTLWCVAIGCGSVALFLVCVGVTSRFRVLGRHCIPVLPVLLFPLGLGLATAWERKELIGRISAISFVVLSLVSCLALRFDSRHARDDYRGAAAAAKLAARNGERVWWNADYQAGLFYGLALGHPSAAPGQVIIIQPPVKGFEAGLQLPDLVLTSKPDVYDGDGHLREFLTRSGYRQIGALPAFTLWRRNH